jgi:hypothetical protein
MILRQPYLRSARMVLVIVGASGLGWLVFSLVPHWRPSEFRELVATSATVALGIAVTFLPWVLASRFADLFGALPGDAYREHRLIGSIRDAMLADRTVDGAVAALHRLEATPVYSLPWTPVRKALRRQLELSVEYRRSKRTPTPEEMSTLTRETFRAWNEAIDRTRHFWR